tara:strand:- start:14481 stop:17645 length:3165 start_codon:yes stop_codon:yes gene_type:complete
MKNLLLLLLLPVFSFGQIINTFPWVHDFENGVALEQDTNDFADWYLMQGSTSSVGTGPSGDHTTGNGIYFYVESSNPNFPNKVFIVYTPRFDVSATPGKVLSFWYHMHGNAMGDLEIGMLDSTGYTALDTISGNQGNQWQLAYYPITATTPFKIKFKAITGSSYTSDIAIDDIMISDPFTVIYGCDDSVSTNYNPLATHNDGSCIYYYGCIDPAATNYNPWANVDNGSCIQNVNCDSTESLIDVAIKLDNWPTETSWEVTANGNIIYSVSSGTYDYTQTGQTVHTQVCIPVGDTIVFTLNDTYGDGIGGGSVVGSCLVTNLDCEDTLFLLNPPNFGSTISSNPYVSDTCNNDTIIYGCTTPSYLEYDSIATVDDGSCMTLASYGCTDSAAFNYDANADRMLLTSPCIYDLILYDDGGDSWGACWLGVEQGDSLWQFKITNNSVYSDTFSLELNSNDEVYFYYFEIPTPQQNTQQLDIQTIQNSFKLENIYGTVIYEGNNPWPGPNENKLRNYKSALDIYEAQPYCGNECIPVVTGCMDILAYNYNSLANTNDTCYYNPGCTNAGYLEYYTQGFVADIDDGSCSIVAVFGCTDSTMFNYDSTANVDNSGCIPVILGCMNDLAFNYNANANTPDTCIPVIYGCMSSIAINYNPLANTDDGSCVGIVYGCTDSTMWNYSPSANTDDGSCIPYIYGCTDPTMYNYNQLANTDNGNCIPFVYGCTDSTMFNYNPLANTNNNSCIPFIYGCTNPVALNFCDSCNTDDFSCILPIYGCMDSIAFNYNPLANVDNGTCVPIILGCTDPIALNYCDSCNTDDFSCILPIYGCTDSTMFNYNPLANVDNNSCIPFVYGCTDPSMLNYDPSANTEDFSCIPYIYGCMDSTALNYDTLANTENGSCIEAIAGCRDPNAFNYNPLANIIAHDSLGCLYAAEWCVNGSGNPFFLNDECYAWVIEVDDYCCENEWDSICELTYNHCVDGWTGSLPPARVIQDKISLYPNPTNNYVYINKETDIEVYNNIGVLIIKKRSDFVDLSNYSSGIYNIITIFMDNKKSHKIIKK